MLRYKKNSIKRIAFKDIVCYKFVEIFNKDTFITPYQGVLTELGKTYIASLTKVDYKGFSEITYGLHSYKNFENAKNKAINFGKEFCVVKCIIPRWSRYYVGEYDCDESFASNKLIYSEIVFKQ